MSTPGVLIRPLASVDIPALWPLLQAMVKTDSEAGVAKRLEALISLDSHYLPIATIADSPVGYAWAQDYGLHLRSGLSTVRLHDLYVAPPHRRLGAGARLFEAVWQWTEQRGAKWLQWQASQDALPFYTSLGLPGDPCPDPGHPFFEIEF
jgi:GNAT superfamily N-acetyltransferase